MLAGEAAAGLIWVDDHGSLGKGIGRQVMIGDEHIDAASLCLGHTIDAGDAVIDRNDDVRRFFLCGERDDFRRQAVTIFEAIGYDVIDNCTHGAQTADRDRTSGSAITIIVGHDHDFFSCFDRIGKKCRCLLHVQQFRGCDQGIQFCG